AFGQPLLLHRVAPLLPGDRPGHDSDGEKRSDDTKLATLGPLLGQDRRLPGSLGGEAGLEELLLDTAEGARVGGDPAGGEFELGSRVQRSRIAPVPVPGTGPAGELTMPAQAVAVLGEPFLQSGPGPDQSLVAEHVAVVLGRDQPLLDELAEDAFT